MTPPHQRLVVITGGPGSGKSTLIGALHAEGISCVEEAGRAIIRDQTAIGGTALHTADRWLFAEVMLAWEMRSHHEAASRNRLVVFDRGVPDLVGYHLLRGIPVPAHVTRAAEIFRYAHRVFVAPPWPQIYGRDAERGQDFDEAVRTHDAMVEAYVRCGYELVPLPLATLAERVAFVRQRLPE